MNNSKWKDTVIKELEICGIYRKAHDDNPKLALNDLILWNIHVYEQHAKQESLRGKIKNIWYKIVYGTPYF